MRWDEFWGTVIYVHAQLSYFRKLEQALSATHASDWELALMCFTGEWGTQKLTVDNLKFVWASFQLFKSGHFIVMHKLLGVDTHAHI